MKLAAFSRRVAKEILRDPLTLIFGLAFPLVLLLLMSLIQSNVPVPLFTPERLTPGIAVFGLSFLTLFSSQLIAKDRESVLLARLCSTPLSPLDFIIGYTLPLLPIAFAQTAICYAVAMLIGLTPSVNVLLAVIAALPAAVFFISLGLFFGSFLTSKQVGGICGALLTNLSAWLSGAWLDLSLVGGVLSTIAKLLPFMHAVELGRDILASSFASAGVHLIWVSAYAVVFAALAVFTFMKKMRDL